MIELEVTNMTCGHCEMAVRKALAKVPGVDIDFGVRNLRGEFGLYERILRKYADNHGDDTRRLRALLSENDRESAHRLAHSLKGVAGTLGFLRIQTAMTELIAGLRAGLSPSLLESPLAVAEAAQAQLLEAIGPEPSGRS